MRRIAFITFAAASLAACSLETTNPNPSDLSVDAGAFGTALTIAGGYEPELYQDRLVNGLPDSLKLTTEQQAQIKALITAFNAATKADHDAIEAILKQAPGCWLLNVGSGLIYGETAKSGQPLDENALLAPVDDYGVTKAAADLALGALVRRGLRVVRLRPFNHIGTGQTEAFAIPAFAMQIARIEAGLIEPVLRVGNLDAKRDFLDVRDVARVYALTVEHTHELRSGVILNVASGIPCRIGDMLQTLLALSRVAIRIEQDAARMRASDLPLIVGDAARARELLGWSSEYNLNDTLAAVLDDYRSRVARSTE